MNRKESDFSQNGNINIVEGSSGSTYLSYTPDSDNPQQTTDYLLHDNNFNGTELPTVQGTIKLIEGSSGMLYQSFSRKDNMQGDKLIPE